MNAGSEKRAWTRGALACAGQCPMCGSDSRMLLGSATDAMLSLPDTWPLWCCQSCHSRWLDPRPDDDSLPAAYDFDYITHGVKTEPARSGVLASLIDGYLNRRFHFHRKGASPLGAWCFAVVPPLRLKLDYYGRHLVSRRRGKLLDIGCGSGDFVALAGQMGWQAEGVDPDPAAVAACRQRGITVTQGFVQQLDEIKQADYWDAVTMSHCIEHVPRPLDLLERAAAMLKPGGTLWIALPNPDSIGARYFGMDWESVDAPRHLVLPSQQALVEACRSAGFEHIRLRRRGAHAKRLFKRSAEIARLRGRSGLGTSHMAIVAISLLADILASLTPRFAEETVLVARKQRRSDSNA